MLAPGAGCRDEQAARAAEQRAFDARVRDAQRAAPRAASDRPTDGQEAAARVEKLGNELATFDGRIAAEVEALARASSEVERAAAQDRLDKLRRDRAQLTERLEAAKAAATRAPRSPP